jgi:hypothetical protein
LKVQLLWDIIKPEKGGITMRKNLKPNPHIAPMPVLIIGTYGRDGTPDAMNAAWGTACDYNQICIFIAKEHKSFENIMLKKEFTVSLADRANLVPADYVGIVSAAKVPDKVARTGWTVEKAENVIKAAVSFLSDVKAEVYIVNYKDGAMISIEKGVEGENEGEYTLPINQDSDKSKVIVIDTNALEPLCEFKTVE